MKAVSFLLLFLLFLTTVAIGNPPQSTRKYIVGAVETIKLVDADIAFKARVDTGAKTCSIYAEDIRVISPSIKMRENVGKKISFRVVTKQGQSKRITSTIVSTSIVKTSESKERRYKISLKLKWNNVEKTVLVTLNNRKKMTYRFLLGRNWLRGDFLVDVEKNSND